MFFLLTVSILLITHGEVKLLAGVYTISFLSVMALFAIGNVLLKLRRNSLPRPEKASWIAVFIAIIAVLIALIGNIQMPPKDDLPSNLTIFLYYFIPVMLFVIIMLNRTLLLKMILRALDMFFNPIRKFAVSSDKAIKAQLNSINNQAFVFFTKGGNISSLNKVMLYVTKNEHTKTIKIVLILKEGMNPPDNLARDIDFLDREYPDIKVELVIERGEFSPQKIKELSVKWNIPINFMFIGSPSDKLPYRIEELGGVRLII